jgi:methylated-DNA-[protein]-cysteine S-methyltransferase
VGATFVVPRDDNGRVDQTVLSTPIGGLGVFTQGDAVSGVSFGAAPTELTGVPDGVLATALAELTGYFAGERVEFDVPTVLTRGSEFERAVWAQIAAIPYGETRTYGAIARAVGEPGGAQAVGTACNRNPLPVIVACHRVVGANGKLVGFGGGLKRKQWLLQLEARVSIDRGVLL